MKILLKKKDFSVFIGPYDLGENLTIIPLMRLSNYLFLHVYGHQILLESS